MRRKLMMMVVAGLMMFPAVRAQQSCDSITLPYIQSFDADWVYSGIVSPPPCWSIYSTDSVVLPCFVMGNSETPHSGATALQVGLPGDTMGAMLLLPPFGASARGIELSFYLYTTSVDTVYMQVGLMADGTDSMMQAVTVGLCAGDHWALVQTHFTIPEDTLSWHLAFDMTAPGVVWRVDDIVIEQGGTCGRPRFFVTDWTDTNQVHFTWEPDAVSGWLLMADTMGTVAVDTNAYLLTGLEPTTAYHSELRALCPAGDTSLPAILDFSTDCLPLAVPYSENFDSYRPGDMPMCWEMQGEDDPTGNYTKSMEVNTTSDFTSGWLTLRAAVTTTGVTALSPVLDASGRQLRVSLRMRSNFPGFYSIGIVAADSGDFLPFLEGQITSSDINGTLGWHEYTFYTDTLTAVSLSQPLRVAINWYSYAMLQIDDFLVDFGDSCHRATDAWIDTAYADTIVVGWEDYSLVPAGYEVRYSTEASLAEAEGSKFFATSPGAVDSLDPARNYHFWVRALCPFDSSRWVYAGNAYTVCGPLRLPYRQDFDDYNYPDHTIPYCWEALSGNWSTQEGDLRGRATPSDTAIIVSPVINVPGDEIYVSFHLTNLYYGASLHVGVIREGDSIFIPLYHPTDTGFHECYTDSLSSTDTVRLAFRLIEPATTSGFVHIDDLLLLNQRCRHPERVRIDSVDVDMARVVITPAVSNQSALYRLTVSHNGVTQVIETTDTIYDLTLLEAGTDYEISVVSLCGGGYTSLSTGTAFRTYCTSLEPDELPYIQDFELLASSQQDPDIDCWSFIHTASSHTVTDGDFSDNALRLDHVGSASVSYVALPPVTYVPDLMLSFDATLTAATSATATIEVGFMRVPDDNLTFEPLDTLYCTIRDLVYFFEVPLGMPTVPGRWPAMRVTTSNQATLAIDNIWLGSTPECSSLISDFTVSNVWSYCADMSWNVNRAHNLNYEYIVRIVHTDGSSAGDFYANVTSLTCCNLDELTSYLAWVELYCGGDLQAVSDTVSFTTRCDNIATIEQSYYSNQASLLANGRVPLDGHTRYSASQQLFTVDEMAHQPATITAIDVHYFNPNLPLDVDDCQIYLSHFDGDSIGEWQTEGLELVYSGPLRMEGEAWHTLYFTTPFEYSGTTGLLVTMVGTVKPVPSGNALGSYNTHRPLVVRYNSSSVPFVDTLEVYSSFERSDMRFHICPGEVELCHSPVLTEVVANSDDITVRYDAGGYPCEMSICRGWIWSGDVEAVNVSGVYTFDSLEYNTVYIVGVRRMCGSERSNWATRRLRTPIAVCPEPSTPWATDITSTEATIAVGSDSVDQRQLHVFNFRLDTIFTSSDTLFQLTDLAPGATYRVAQRTFCGEDFELHSAWSDTMTFTTGFCHPVASASVRADGLTAALVNWVDDSLGDTGRYRVEYGYRGYQRHEALGSWDVGGNELRIEGLEPEQMYDFYVASLCSDGTRSVWTYAGGVPPVGVEPVSGLLPQVTVYPNPASGRVSVDYEGGAPASLVLYDVGGRTIIRRDALEAHQELDLTGLVPGPYFVRVTSAAGTSVGKLIVR